MSLLKLRAVRRIVDNTDPQSVSASMRRRRMKIFLRFVRDMDPPVRVLDVGGTERYWLSVGVPDVIRLVLLNRSPAEVTTPGMEVVTGDARDMSMFAEGEFDIVFSNSVIEHVGSFSDQAAMAREVQRVGRRFFVQTPNRYFPIEPHFLFPGFQFLPLTTRAWLHCRFDLGWMRRAESAEAAMTEVKQLRLLSRAELQKLFPHASVHVERFAGIPKSFVAYGMVSSQ